MLIGRPAPEQCAWEALGANARMFGTANSLGQVKVSDGVNRAGTRSVSETFSGSGDIARNDAARLIGGDRGVGNTGHSSLQVDSPVRVSASKG